MMVSGSATLHASPDAVWRALNDPAVLVRTIPGCQRLEAVGEDAYTMTVTAGVASIKGLYTGQVRLGDQQPPDSFLLTASGSGAPGTVSADVRVKLTDAGGGTTSLTYDADAIVGGMIGGVGQRMLTGVAKKTAGEFFAAVDAVLNGRAGSPAASPAAGVPAASGQDGAPQQTVFEAPGATAALQAPGGFLPGALIGAGAALVGVLVGGWLSGRRRRG
jgi:carbon monoxide dehydrogenase subunit G